MMREIFDIGTRSEAGDNAAQLTHQRRALYFCSGDRQIFGWYHPATAEHAKNCAVVICNPLGHEYTHSHRSLRHLAENLARSGIATLRFDYDATGDSPGDNLLPDRVNCWLQDIRAATTALRELSGCTEIGLLGVRMGATLAAVIASTEEIAHLVLWSPCSGKNYMREMKALARMSATETENTIGFESAGFMFLHETAERLKRINLSDLQFRSECDVLLLQRDDIEADTLLEEHIRQCGAEVTQLAVPGYIEMMAEPQFTAVPTDAINVITNWLTERISTRSPQIGKPQTGNHAALLETTTTQDGVELLERCYQFGQYNHLFGVVTMPKNPPAGITKPTVVLANSGSVHRVGPNRLYVTLARKLAALGFTCLRFDLQGLGDSVSIKGERENHPYPSSAISDTASALQFLQTQLGCTRFVIAGLCSGAHTAFHCALDLSQYDIAEALLINPLTFHYVEGMSLQTSQQFQEVEHYKKSARNPKSWLKLLRGKVDLAYLATVAGSQAKTSLTSLLQGFNERFVPNRAPQLAKNLHALHKQQRSLILFIANGDPGYAILIAEARYTANKYIQKGFLNLHFIANGDHTFSASKPRTDLIGRICKHMQSRFG